MPIFFAENWRTLQKMSAKVIEPLTAESGDCWAGSLNRHSDVGYLFSDGTDYMEIFTPEKLE
jgi:hypothetical protein